MADTNEQATPSTDENKPAEATEATVENTTKPTTDTPEAPLGPHLFDSNSLGILNDVTISLTIEVGRAQIKIRDLLNLSKGSVIELNKAAGDPVDIYANGKLISIGNIITANGKYCVRLISIPESSQIGVENGK